MFPAPIRAVIAALIGLSLAAAPALAADLPAPGPAAEAEADPDVPAFDPIKLAVRHQQLTLHQGFGLATLGAMGLTTALGAASIGSTGTQLREAHLALAGLTSGLYLASAGLALTSPPPLRPHERNPTSSVAIHEYLAWLHATGMFATVGTGAVLALGGPGLEPYHRVFGLGTLGLMALSAGAIAFLP